MYDDDHLRSGRDIIASIRSTDPRIDMVIAAFVAQRLSWTLGDPVDQITPVILQSGDCGSYVIAATRLLNHLDSLTARAWVAENGEDAHLAVMTRLNERVRELTYQRDQARAALQSRRRADAAAHDLLEPVADGGEDGSRG